MPLRVEVREPMGLRCSSSESPESEAGKKRLVITFSQRFDVRNYDIELDFEPQKSYLSVKARLEVAAKLDAGEPLRLIDVREDDEWRAQA